MMKKKIIAIGIILLFIGVAFSPVNAKEIRTTEVKDEKIELVLTDVDAEGNLISKVFKLTEIEFDSLQEILTKIVDEFKIFDGSIIDVILRWLEDKLPYLYEIVMIIVKAIRELKNNILDGLGNLAKYTVISIGSGYKFNPFKKSSMTIRQRAFTRWHYSGTGTVKGKTHINYPMMLKGRTISGRQIGYMKNFTGFYIYNAKNLPQQSFTFFIGRAELAMGFRLINYVILS